MNNANIANATPITATTTQIGWRLNISNGCLRPLVEIFGFKTALAMVYEHIRSTYKGVNHEGVKELVTEWFNKGGVNLDQLEAEYTTVINSFQAQGITLEGNITPPSVIVPYFDSGLTENGDFVTDMNEAMDGLRDKIKAKYQETHGRRIPKSQLKLFMVKFAAHAVTSDGNDDALNYEGTPSKVARVR